MAKRSACWTHSWRGMLCGFLATAWGLTAVSAMSDGSELRKSPIVKAASAARPSVVNIRGEKTITGASVQVGHAESGRRVNGMGTGVVIDDRGYVLTNHHVVDGVREIQITLDDGSKHTARLVARDPETDLAIIKLDVPQSLPVIRIGTSSDLMPGEQVIAIGNAYGYEHTVTRGIISALRRPVQVSDAQFYNDLIQTDASINPGNSGGPLLNIDGDMIGINVAVRAGAQGIGFAIPVDKAMAVAAKLMADAGQKSHWHGIELSKEETPSDKGIVVAAVDKDSPAEKAGLKVGDLLTSVGTIKLARPLDFHRAVVEMHGGQQVEMSVARGEEKLDLEFEMADPPSGAKGNSSPAWETIGLELKPVPASEFREQYQKFAKDYRGGLVISAVRPQSPAAERGLRRGDVLVGMHDRETTSLKDLKWIMENTDFSKVNPVQFFIIRDQLVFFGQLPVSVAQGAVVRSRRSRAARI